MIEIIIHGGKLRERAAMLGDQAETESVDVLIVGAGLSGIGAAVYLQRLCPGKSYAILEARDAIGGTWDLFRFPGVRSDSDMYTLGYTFRPWAGPRAIVDGSSIRRYIADTAREAGIDARIRFGQRVTSAAWCGNSARWTVAALCAGGAIPVLYRCQFLYICSGYYSYGSAHRPQFPGEASYAGTLVHPQFWPDGLDYTGKQVVVIGSGATAVTLIPAMAKGAAHVTMLQRSPSYVFSLPAEDAIANRLRRWLPARAANSLARMKNVLVSMVFFQLARRRPQIAKKWLIGMVQKQLPRDFDVARHFTPRYNPWDQRVCVVPDGDLFKAIRRGAPEVRSAIARGCGGDGDGIEIEPIGRHPNHGGWSAGRPFPVDGLQGRDVQRYPEHGVCLRIHERIVDIESRARRQVCLPADQVPGLASLCGCHAAARSAGCRRALSRLHIGLCRSRQ
jgi:monooxygenase